MDAERNPGSRSWRERVATSCQPPPPLQPPLSSSVHESARRLINFLCNSILPPQSSRWRKGGVPSRHPSRSATLKGWVRERERESERKRKEEGNFRHCRIADLIKSRAAKFPPRKTGLRVRRDRGQERIPFLVSNQRRFSFSVANFHVRIVLSNPGRGSLLLVNR